MKKYIVQNGRELTEKQYIIYLEGMAYGIWAAKIKLAGEDDCCKWSDPLYINSLDDVYSYVFDFHDGGRHHKFSSLEEIHQALLKEIK
jgi:hypothetical protein